MAHCSTVLNQIVRHLPRGKFEKFVREHGGDRRVRGFSCWKLFLSQIYAQLSGVDSLRDLETALRSKVRWLYHLGLDRFSRSTMADANEKRPAEIFEKMFKELVRMVQSKAPGHSFKFKNPLYTIDATTIDLCLSVFPWAKYRRAKGAIKMHCLYDHSGALPSFLTVTDGKKPDVRVVKETSFPLSPDSIVSVDKANIDYKWLYSLDRQGVWFVSRAKSNIDCEITGQHTISGKGVLIDERIVLQGVRSKKFYSKELRRIMFYDEERKKVLTFLTNNFKLAASTIAQIYK